MTTLAEAIAALGTTEEEVTSILREKGIKGYPQRATCCPIAKYLNACGFPVVTVATSAHIYQTENSLDSIESMPLPKGVTDWIWSFDAGKYPEFRDQESHRITESR